MTRFLGSDFLRGLGNRYRSLDNIRPWENGQRWTSSRAGGGGMPNTATFRGLDRFESDRIEVNTRKGTNPAPFVSKGHTLDANTIGLWRFDDQRVDNRNDTFQDATGTTWTIVGHQGVCSYDPIPGLFARKFVQNRIGVTADHTMITHATSTTLQNMCYGSWTFEAYIRFDTIATANVIWNIGGPTGSEVLADNTLALVYLDNVSGWFRVLWETGAGVDTLVSQSAGTKPVAGVWYYVAIVKDTAGKTVSFYLDGVLQQSVAYVNEPTGGTTGGIAVPGQNQTASGGDTGGDISVRHMQWSAIARTNSSWFEESARRKTTHGFMQKDSNVLFGLQFFDEPSAIDISGYGHHLISTATGTDGTAPVFSLIPGDGGAGRSFLNCTLATWHSETIRSAILDSFTAEVWIQILGPVPVTGNGIFHHGGNPGSETQANNRHGMNIVAAGAMAMTMEHGAGVNTTGDVYTSPGSFELGRRYHIAFRKTMTGATWTGALFVDGVKVAESYANINADGSTQADQVIFQVGGGCGVLGDISRFFGFMDDFRLSNIARTDAEIVASYNSGSGIGTPPSITIISPDPDGAIGGTGFPSDLAIALQTPIVVQIDAPSGLGYASIVVRYPDGVERVAYRRGAFRSGFAAHSYEEHVSATVLRLHVLPDGGWPNSGQTNDITFDVDAVDALGSQISEIGASS